MVVPEINPFSLSVSAVSVAALFWMLERMSFI
jgi:hypothetical protein